MMCLSSESGRSSVIRRQFRGLKEIGMPVFTVYHTDVGALTLVAHGARLLAILWPDDRPGRVPLPPLERDDTHSILFATMRQLDEYFAGARHAFDLPLQFSGTPFQRSV